MNFACSSFSWETNDKKHLLGRTYECFKKYLKYLYYN